MPGSKKRLKLCCRHAFLRFRGIISHNQTSGHLCNVQQSWKLQNVEALINAIFLDFEVHVL